MGSKLEISYGKVLWVLKLRFRMENFCGFFLSMRFLMGKFCKFFCEKLTFWVGVQVPRPHQMHQ